MTDEDVPADVVVHRLAAFTSDPSGGNPAGVVVTGTPLPQEQMQQVAAEVGYSETAFLARPSEDARSWDVRYFSPVSEVPFCGHATIASGVLLGREVGVGTFTLSTPAGTVPVTVAEHRGVVTATLTSVTPHVDPVGGELVTEVLAACGLGPNVLDPAYPPAIAYAGARHLVLVLRDRAVLDALTYDFDRVRRAMVDHDLTTVACLWPDPGGPWHARNLFAVGGVVEDPATGAAAAAFGAYLRDRAVLDVPAAFEILQGRAMGRPSRLHVGVPDAHGGIRVTGTAVPITAP